MEITTNRLFVVLLVITIALQVTMLYRQPGSSRNRPIEAIQTAPEGTVLDIADFPNHGNTTAKVAMVEFSDYECPFCARHAESVGKILKEEYINTGLVRIAFVNNPLPSHKSAKLLATAAICAGEQSHYWAMHDELFTKNPTTDAEILVLTEKLGLDTEKFKHCLEQSPLPAKRIENDLLTAESLGLAITPAFAIGRIDGKSRLTIAKFVMGARPIGDFRKVLAEAIANN